ncbi:MAG: UDP-N-acetylmuramoyl-tripeptide--D-alanyl-D-alanine ligase [Proteobacteria bacterium]|nr:UDP-N-acetylmuramoyl-tripeptide--D-alanyl-D-alanine ligase [Pseudomonadota bacterium]
MLTLLLTLAASLFATARLQTYLQVYQQEEYDTPRFFAWMLEKRAADKWATLGLLLGSFILLLPTTMHPAYPLFAAAWLGWRLRQEPSPTQTGKKPLVPTPRANRLWWLASALATIPLAFIATQTHGLTQAIALIAFIQTIPLWLAAANLLLWPLQFYQNQQYLAECTTLLQRLNPLTIGLTGSFGKTSTKYILNHILSSHKPTLMTPGSTNTPLGIARIVREQLQPHHSYFIAEMGAYGPGSIARLCKLAPPKISAITAVGDAHYERFKSLAAVAQTKFEISQFQDFSPQTQGNLCVLAIDGIPPEHWQPRVSQNSTRFLLVSQNAEHIRGPHDFHITQATQTPQGLKLTIRHAGVETTFQTPLFGMQQVGNLGVAFALATQLGLAKKAIAAAMASVPAAPHRLNVKREGTQTVIDDSYNSNPKGFAAALEVLELVAQSREANQGSARRSDSYRAGGQAANRKILITPGMVELGTLHATEHAKLGQLAAQKANIILAVNPTRIPTFLQAAQTQNQAQVIPVATLAAARQWLQANGQPHDVILIENDLPDRYESRWTL